MSKRAAAPLSYAASLTVEQPAVAKPAMPQQSVHRKQLAGIRARDAARLRRLLTRRSFIYIPWERRHCGFMPSSGA